MQEEVLEVELVFTLNHEKTTSDLLSIKGYQIPFTINDVFIVQQQPKMNLSE